MTKETINSLTKKIHWFVLPLFISLLTWIVVMVYSTKETTSVITTELKNQKEMSEKIYKSLEHKLDVEVYTVKHDEVVKDIKEVQYKVDRIYNRQTNHYSQTNQNYKVDLANFHSINHVDTGVNNINNKINFIYRTVGLIPQNDTLSYTMK